MSHNLAFIKASCGIVSITPVAASNPSSKSSEPYKTNLPAIVPKRDMPNSPDPRMLVERPHNYHVVMLDDDFTSRHFVERVLQKHFHRDAETACKITMQVHREGLAVAGTYSYEVAEHKAHLVTQAAEQSGFPFKLRLDRV